MSKRVQTPPSIIDGAPNRSSADRVANLDLLRALAIISVIGYHFNTLKLWSADTPGLNVLKGGWAGVDLFFVLSGWLVGGLYWKEVQVFGSVQVPRFMLRRLIRTIPPYLVFLQFSYFAKRVYGNAPVAYDWGYWVFIQNYYREIPYFQVSWSLCIEEHFYLFLPLILILARKLGRGIHLFFLAVFLLPLILRIALVSERTDELMRPPIATHLRLDGLAIGVWCAYLQRFELTAWLRIKSLARRFFPFAIVCVFLNFAYPPNWMNRWGFTLLALSFMVLLVALVEERSFLPFGSRSIYFIATWSYSLYLVHPLVINVYRSWILRRVPLYVPIHVLLLTALILLAGFICHVFVERTAMNLRDRWVARRT